MEFSIPLIVALISSTSAIIGILSTQLFSMLRDHFEKRYKRKVLLREKFEELNVHISDSHDWIGKILNADSLSELNGLFPVSARSAKVLSNIYFPEFQQACSEFYGACGKFLRFKIDRYQPNERNTRDLMDLPGFRDKIEKDAFDEIRNCLIELDNKMIQYINDYNKS